MSNFNGDESITSGDQEKSRHGTAELLASPPHSEDSIRLEFTVTSTANLDAAIQSLVDIIEQDEQQLRSNKRMVNQLCQRAGKPPMYSDAEASGSSQTLGNIRPDQYYGQPLATAIRAILEARRASNMGAASVREIYETLVRGGFKFDAKDENALRGLRQSLTKNSGTFHKLPNGTYGLLEWYPGAKPARPSEGDDDE